MSAEELENRIKIVDNEDEDRSVGVVLRSNLETATRLDIATGYFEVGGLFALGDAWQSLDSVRILMGSATGSRTKKLLLDEMGPYLRDRFDEGLARGRTENPLFVGLLQIAEAMRDGRIECRLHADKGRKFHAKAFLVYGRLLRGTRTWIY